MDLRILFDFCLAETIEMYIAEREIDATTVMWTKSTNQY